MTVVVPAFNEERGIRGVVNTLREIAKTAGYPFEILVVDDGSTDSTGAILAEEQQVDTVPVKVLRNPGNRGYGYSLKSGIREAAHSIVVITDADGTYPNDRIPELVAKVRAGAAMAVGARSLGSGSIPISRRPAKLVLNKLSNFLAGRRVPDYNSGLRAMRKRLGVSSSSRSSPTDSRSPLRSPSPRSPTDSWWTSCPSNMASAKANPRFARSATRRTSSTSSCGPRSISGRSKFSFRSRSRSTRRHAEIALRDIFSNVNYPNARLIGDMAVLLFLAGMQVLATGFLADLACDAFRPKSAAPRRRSSLDLYDNPLGFFLAASAFLLLISIFFHLRDKYALFRNSPPRALEPKTLLVYVTTLQLLLDGPRRRSDPEAWTFEVGRVCEGAELRLLLVCGGVAVCRARAMGLGGSALCCASRRSRLLPSRSAQKPRRPTHPIALARRTASAPHTNNRRRSYPSHTSLASSVRGAGSTRRAAEIA